MHRTFRIAHFRLIGLALAISLPARAERINQAIDQLNTASHKLADVLYKQAASQTGAGPEAGSSSTSGSKPAEGEVIDADYVDVDDKRK